MDGLLKRRDFIAAVGLLFWVTLYPSPALCESRLALVIGNAAYRNVKALSNSVRDANLISSSLRSVGFDVASLVDVGLVEMKQGVRNFGSRIGKGDIVFFYFAGHGVQHNGENYLVPVDAVLGTPADLRHQAVSMSEVFSMLPGSAGVTNIVVLDACRNNPFSSQWASGGRSAVGMNNNSERALKPVDAPAGLMQLENIPGNTLIAYATSPGKVALDGEEGGSSPYATALASVIVDEGVEVAEMFQETTRLVKMATNHQQEPWVNLSLNAKVFFKKRKQNRVVW